MNLFGTNKRNKLNLKRDILCEARTFGGHKFHNCYCNNTKLYICNLDEKIPVPLIFDVISDICDLS